MRSATASVVSAIEAEAFRLNLSAVFEKTRNFFKTLDSNNAPESIIHVDAGVIDDDAAMQEIIWSSDLEKIVTFYSGFNNKVYYQVQGAVNLFETNITPNAKIGIYGDVVFFVDASTGHLNTGTVDWTAVGAGGSAVFTSISEVDTFDNDLYSQVHAVSETECVVITGGSSDCGFIPVYHRTDGFYNSRLDAFAFPTTVKFVDGDYLPWEHGRSQTSLSRFSTALKFGDDVHVYMSNPVTGSVECTIFKHNSHTWGDIFPAIAADLESSQSEFRVSNSFVNGTSAFIVGQFTRSNVSGTFVPHVMVCRSTDAKTFAIEPQSLVSTLGYRFSAVVSGSTMHFASCNRITSQPASITFTGGSTPTVGATSVSRDNILSYSDNSGMEGDMALASGSESYITDANIASTSLCRVYMGYNNLSTQLFNTYIVEKKRGARENGKRANGVTLVHEGKWRLNSMASPFYSQFISKAAMNTQLKEYDTIYSAGSSGWRQDVFAVDFWGCEAYSSTSGSITGVNITANSGVDKYLTDTGSHKLGIKSKLLSEIVGTYEDPVIMSGSATVKIYGWSSGSSVENDKIGIILFTEDEDGFPHEIFHDTNQHWPNTYPITVAGNAPIETTIPDLIKGHKLKNVGLWFESSEQTTFCPARVQFESGVSLFISLESTNTPWVMRKDDDYVTDDLDIPGEGVRLPGYGHPYIMFGTQPFDTVNFTVSAKFYHNLQVVKDSVPGPIGFGLVGLATDASNYIVARYNVANMMWELVKVKERKETVITSASTGNIDGLFEMSLAHRDGNFQVHYRIPESGNPEWIRVINYHWKASDGWMVEDKTVSKHTGIYGVIHTPSFTINGYDCGLDEEGHHASDYIAMLPGNEDVLTYFGTSGSAYIDGNLYTYGTVVNPAYAVEGPYQLRSYDNGLTYQALTNKIASVQSLLFDYGKTADTYLGGVVAFDNGCAFRITGSDWQVDNNGTPLLRSTLEAQASNLGVMYGDMSTKCYVTGGIGDLNLISGEAMNHGYNARVYKAIEGSVWCYEFMSAGEGNDFIIRDLVDRICKSFGASAEFPGDTINATFSVTTSPTLLKTMEYVEGYDLRFDFDSTMSVNDTLDIISDTVIRDSGTTKTMIRIKLVEKTGETYAKYSVSFGSWNDTTFVEYDRSNIGTVDFTGGHHHVRIVYHTNFVSIYMDDKWAMTTSYANYQNDDDPLNDIKGIQYGESVSLYIQASSAMTINNVLIPELCDWREGIFIDLETGGEAAISSVIQQRPIEIVAKANGSLAFWYEPTRSVINQNDATQRSHEWESGYPTEACSDALIYFSDVKTMQYTPFAEDFGFSTRVYRMSELSVGALKAAKVLMKRLYEQSEIHSIRIRPDVRIETGDQLHIEYVASGTLAEENFDIIVEGVSLEVPSFDGLMRIQGRKVIS